MEAAELRLSKPGPHGRALLGSILLRNGAVTPAQLEEALEEKERSGRLGEILLQRGWVTEAVVAQALAEQHGLEFIDLRLAHIDAAVSSLLPEKFARRLGAVPVRMLGEDSVLVAVADPTNVVASDDLRMALGLTVKLAVSEVSGIARALDRAHTVETPSQSQPAVVGGRRMESVDVSAAGGGTPAIAHVNNLVSRAIAEGASDLHFEPQADGMVVRARVDGVMRRLGAIPRDMQAAVTSRLKVMGELDIAERRAPQDGRVSITFGGSPMDLRMAVIPTTYGEQVVLRILSRGSRALDAAGLGMSEDTAAIYYNAISQPYGAIIACGPTGSGKTTTLYAALDHLNDDDRVIMTIEDPVEYQIEGLNQVEVNARAGLTFARGLRTILRSDPDVLLVGEIRDDETARIAVQAALTGHLVLTTLHTHNAASSIARLKDMGVAPSLLATAVDCIIAQRLARRLCVACREAYSADAEWMRQAGFHEEALVPGQPSTLYRARGCADCAGTGYRGRVALYEILQVRGRIRRLIEASTEEIFAAAVEDGMRTLRQDGLRLCLAGVSSLEEIRRVTGDRLV